jgi:predicted Rossmann fold flavoprotein
MYIKNQTIYQKKSLERKIEIHKVIIIGAGAAGLMAAYSASIAKKETIVIEKNSIPGKKLLITGKGRCNLTNESDNENIINNVTKNGRFLYSSLSEFSAYDIIDFFNRSGLQTKTERGNRVFPASDSSGDVVDTLYKLLKSLGVRFEFRKQVRELIIEDGIVKGVVTDKGQAFYADSVIICTGGASYPKTGSNGDGYGLARSAGHTVTEILPGLVPLETAEPWTKDLMGLSLRNIRLDSYCDDKLIFSEMGEMIFTHFGISGPLVLSLSSCIPDKIDARHRYSISIDLKPALDRETLDKRLLRDFSENLNKLYKNSLNKLLPSKLIPVIIKLSDIDQTKEVNMITKQERERLAGLLKDMRMTVTAKRPIDEAIITKGGVDLRGIDPKTLQSKIVKGLYFAGEILDLDALTGGYNLTIAFSTGYKAGSRS